MVAKKETITGEKEKAQKNVLLFSDIHIQDIPLVGGKTASLGEMYNKLTEKGIRVPNGFAITAHAYWEFLRGTGLDKKIKQEMKALDITDVRVLRRVGKAVRTLILQSDLPKNLEKDIGAAYTALTRERKETHTAVAVRSSATAEDLPDASFAGQQETYLNVRGEKELLLAVKKCIASLFTDRAISYRETKGFDHLNIALSVAVQVMVRSDVGASGVLFTLDTESGFAGVVLINAAYGLGEYVVKGRVTPDQFYVFKEGVKAGKDAIISRTLGTKEVKLGYGKTSGTRQFTVSPKDRQRFAITDKDVVTLAKWGMMIESHYHRPQDIEWAKDGVTGDLYIVQARPETVKARVNHSMVEEYRLKQTGKVIATGTAVGQKIGAGAVRVVNDPSGMHDFKKGEILVTRLTDPDWEPIMRLAAAIVTEEGGKTSHAAIVSRELGVPCVVGVKNARKVLKTGQKITVSASGGDEGIIYQGILPFEVHRTEVKDVAKTKTKVMMNVGDPDHAFALSFLPSDGVGLAREEFIFTNFIRIHPLALARFDSLKDKAAKKKIAEMTKGYKHKTDYAVDKLADGIARIAAAFYPHDVIIRLSDFKTNEYATLVGGKEFEPKEENPMLGWRGASRYYSAEYRDGFKIECDAIKKVRNDWGLSNVIVMVPFCRTPEEGEKVLTTMEEFGLKRGEHGLKVYVMCEIPSNVILAEDFAKIFDGFSIGSNDLTQLTLGVDRDSALVSHVYKENNTAVKRLIRDVIATAHRHGRKVGICGQAPSDDPAFAEFLVRCGVDSISLNPDTVLPTRSRIAAVEKTIGKTGKKTHPTVLGFVVAFGLFSATLLGLGAGCAGTPATKTVVPTIDEWSPAELRERFTAKMQETSSTTLATREAQFRDHLTTFRGATFADFTVQYPGRWTLAEWSGGVAMKDEQSGDYISIFKQLVDHPVAATQKQSIIVGGKPAFRYEEKITIGETQETITIVEIPVAKNFVIEINGRTKDFDRLLATFAFVPTNDGLPSGPVTHWDIREGRACIQVLTYARPTKTASCQVFSTPCDVPDNWEVCDAGDTS